MNPVTEVTQAVSAAREARADEFGKRLRPTLEKLGRRQYIADHRTSLKLTEEPPELDADDGKLLEELTDRLDAVGAPADELLNKVAKSMSAAIRTRAFMAEYQSTLTELPTQAELSAQRAKLQAELEEVQARIGVEIKKLEHAEAKRREAEAGVNACLSIIAAPSREIASLMYYATNPERQGSIRPGARRMDLPIG